MRRVVELARSKLRGGHQESFEKALYAIEDSFPTGKLPGMEEFASLYVNSSQGDGDMEGPWNSGDLWDRDEGPTLALDGGDGRASVKLAKPDAKVAAAMFKRTMPIRPASRLAALTSAQARAPAAPLR